MRGGSIKQQKMKKKLLTKKLKALLDQHPINSASEKLEDVLCLAVFCAGPIRWYVFEGSECGSDDYLMSVIVTNWIEDEIGVVRIKELQDFSTNPMIFILTRSFNNGLMQAMPLPGFTPCAMKDIKGDIRLKLLLKKFRD